MNYYAQRLAELQSHADHELKEIGDQWQTPKPLAFGLFWHFAPKIGPVVLDLFADDCNHLAGNYYTAEINAFTQDWSGDLKRLGGAAFGNPPYSRPCSDEDGTPITGIENVLQYCREQREQGAKIILLLKAATSDGWWPEDADFIQFISGRIGFQTPDWYVPRDPKKDKPSSSGFASAVIIFDKEWQWERRPTERLSRHLLETQGQIIINMIESRANIIVAEREQAALQVMQIIPTQIEETSDIEPVSQDTDSPIAEECEPVAVQLDDIDQAEADAPADDNYQLPFVAEQEEDFADKTLDEIETKTPEKEWPRILCELIALFGVQEKYSHSELMFALTSLETNGAQCGTEEKNELATYIDSCVRTTSKSLPLLKRELITAVAAGFHYLNTGGEKVLFRIVQVMRNAVIGEDCNQPSVDLSKSDVPALSAEWLREQYMQLEEFADLLVDVQQETIDKTIRAASDIDDEHKNSHGVPKVADVISEFFTSNPTCRTYMNIRSLRSAFRSLVQASVKEVANG